MPYEVQGGLVKHVVLLLHDALLLAEGTDSARPAHALVEVRVDGAPECCADFVQLVVSAQVGLADSAHQVNHKQEAS